MNMIPASADYDYDSIANMNVKSRFVAREIYGDATSIVEYLLADLDNMSPLKWDSELDKVEKVLCPHCGEELELDLMTTPFDRSIDVKIDESAPLEERFLCPICESGYPTEEEARECCGSLLIYQCPYCQQPICPDEIETPDDRYPMEWAIVTDWFAQRLTAIGEMVLKSDDDVYFWGRMSNCLYEKDTIINQICYSLGILEGQENYHEVKKSE